MHQYRQVIQRLRLGESDRAIARAERVGRVKVAALRECAAQRGWLDPAGPMPDDASLGAGLGTPQRPPQNLSSVEPFREQLLAWHGQGIQATTIHRALARNHGYGGSVHAVYRVLSVGVQSDRLHRAAAARRPAWLANSARRRGAAQVGQRLSG